MTKLFNFQGITTVGNMSLQYVNSNICTLRLGLDLKGGLVVAGLLASMHDLSQVEHLHHGK